MILLSRAENVNPKKNNLYGAISIGLALTLTVFILNFLFQIVKIPKLQGLPILISPFVSFVGFIFGIIGFYRNKNTLSLLGIIFNIILFIFPFAFWYIGYIVEILTTLPLF